MYKENISVSIQHNMKNYMSLGSSPNTNYMRFNDNSSGSGNRNGSGSFGSPGSPGSPGSIRGWDEDAPFKRFETYATSHAKPNSDMKQNLQSLSISQNPAENYKHNADIACETYTSEDIINLNNKKSFPNSIRQDEVSIIVLPFYIPVIDLVIANGLHVEIVDHSSKGDVDKNNVICSGKIRKYRINGVVKNYDMFVEIGNENIYHVKKRGIMMRVRVKDELRQIIVKTMVNYVADGGEIHTKNNSLENISIGGGGGGGGGVKKRTFSLFGCFKS